MKLFDRFKSYVIMKKKLNCILLIDDNAADNRYHQIILEEMNITKRIQIAETAMDALDYLKTENQIFPQLIFLDINMPGMNGWAFLEAYQYLYGRQKEQSIILILTTSTNPDEKKRAEEITAVNGYKVKPLSEEMLNEILAHYFSNNTK